MVIFGSGRWLLGSICTGQGGKGATAEYVDCRARPRGLAMTVVLYVVCLVRHAAPTSRSYQRPSVSSAIPPLRNEPNPSEVFAYQGLMTRFARESQKIPDFLLAYRHMALMAAKNGMALRLCGQPEYLSLGIQEAACIDVARLSEIAGRQILGRKPGHRGKQCACSYSRDIGAYETCPHGCAYCYALSDVKRSRMFYREHDRSAEWLRRPRMLVKEKLHRQLRLFARNLPDSMSATRAAQTAAHDVTDSPQHTRHKQGSRRHG